MSSGSFGGVMVGVRGTSLLGARAASGAPRSAVALSISRDPSVDDVSRTRWTPASNRAGNDWQRDSGSGDGQYRRSCRACLEVVHPMVAVPNWQREERESDCAIS